MKTKKPAPIPVERALRKLGADLQSARRRRRLPARVLAERVAVSPKTLGSLERGSPTVGMGTYAAVMFALGLIDRLANLADVRADDVGLQLESERLPQRVRLPSRARDAIDR